MALYLKNGILFYNFLGSPYDYSLNFCPICNMTYLQTATFPLPIAKCMIHEASIITVNKETYLFAGPYHKDYIYIYVWAYIGFPLFWQTDASKPAEACKTRPPELRWAGFGVQGLG